jgi:hypothetical protein
MEYNNGLLQDMQNTFACCKENSHESKEGIIITLIQMDSNNGDRKKRKCASRVVKAIEGHAKNIWAEKFNPFHDWISATTFTDWKNLPSNDKWINKEAITRTPLLLAPFS